MRMEADQTATITIRASVTTTPILSAIPLTFLYRWADRGELCRTQTWENKQTDPPANPIHKRYAGGGGPKGLIGERR